MSLVGGSVLSVVDCETVNLFVGIFASQSKCVLEGIGFVERLFRSLQLARKESIVSCSVALLLPDCL